jgi:hypothetical protein
MPGLNDANQKRLNLRPQLESGKSRHTHSVYLRKRCHSGEPLGEGLLKKNWPELLDAHYQCEVPGPSACLQDALHMITTGKVRITCPGAKKEEGKEPRTLSELEVHVVKQWYDAKDKQLVVERGELYVTERNLSSAACAYHEENQEAHATTQHKLDDQSKKLDLLESGVAAIAHAVGAVPGDLEAQQKHQRATLAKTTKDIKTQQAETAAGIGKMAYLRDDPTMMRFVVEKVQPTIEGAESPGDSLVLVEAAEQPLSQIPAPPAAHTSPTDAPESTAGKEDAAIEEAEAAAVDVAMGGEESAAAGPAAPTPVSADKRIEQRPRRDVVMEDVENKDAKGTLRFEHSSKREVSVESEYSIGDARFVCFRLVGGGDSGQDATRELYRRPAAEVHFAAPAAEPEGEAETDVEPNNAEELTKNACVKVRKTAQPKGLRGKTGTITKLEEDNLRYPGKILVKFEAATTGYEKASSVNFERAHLRIVRGPPFAEAVAAAGSASSSAEGQARAVDAAELPKKRFVLNQLVKVEAVEEKHKKSQRKFLFRRGEVVGVPGGKGQTYHIAFTEQRNGAETGAKTTRKFLGRNLVEADDLQEPDESESEDDEEVDRAEARGRKRKAADGAAGGSRGKKRVAPDVEENNALATCMEEEEEEKIYGGMIRALRAAKSSRSSGGVASEDDVDNCKVALGSVYSVFLDTMTAKEDGDADDIPEGVNRLLGKAMSGELRRSGKKGIVAVVNAIIIAVKQENTLTADFYPAPVVAEVQA